MKAIIQVELKQFVMLPQTEFILPNPSSIRLLEQAVRLWELSWMNPPLYMNE